MLAAQLTGRLLSVLDDNVNIQNLLRQCDEEGPIQNALVPTYHCMHTPGGPLKYSLEGHVFAVFGFKLTSDYRYIVSVSNQFISWDISSSDLARQVNPKVEGLMMGLEISPDNRYIAAYTNNDQTILLNNLTSDFKIIDNPFQDNESMTYNDNIQGLILLDTNLIIYGKYSWVLFDTEGTRIRLNRTSWSTPILEIRMISMNNYSFLHWSGDMNNTDMTLATYKDDDLIQPLEFHNGIALNKTQTKAWVCSKPDSNDIQMYEFRHGQWYVGKNYENKEHPLVEIKLSQDEQYIIGTHMTGFILWKASLGMSWKRFGGLGGVSGMASQVGQSVAKPKKLALPPGIRNVSKRMNLSNSCILSSGHKYAIAGIRKQMYIWNVSNEELVKCFDAHFGRIIDVQPLTMGDWNLAITSSIDRTVKVWNTDYMFEHVHEIDRHEMKIDSVQLSTSAGIAITVTRNCIGVWNILTGKLLSKLAHSTHGAICTHAVITTTGKLMMSAESGFVLYWNVKDKSVIYQEEQENVLQMFLFENESSLMAVSRIKIPTLNSLCIVRNVPGGKRQFQFQFPYRQHRDIVLTSDEKMFVAYGCEAFQDIMFTFSAKKGDLIAKYPIKYPDFKEVSFLVPIPDKPDQVAFIDQDKANIIDVTKAKPKSNLANFIKAIPNWGGNVDKRGRYGLYAPAKGGLDLLDLHKGTVKRELIPKIAEGIFNVICKFNETNEYVLYYHSGRKTLRVFRVSDGAMIANYRVPADLTAIESTTDGNNIVLGMVDGNLTVLTIADPIKPDMKQYLNELPSRAACRGNRRKR